MRTPGVRAASRMLSKLLAGGDCNADASAGPCANVPTDAESNSTATVLEWFPDSSGMRLFGWLTRASPRADDPLRDWRRDCEAAIARPDRAAHARLGAQLAARRGAADDIEVEQEMLDALEALVTLVDQLAASGLPVVDTSHRVIRGETCHFTAPASMPEHPAQPSGRLLFTPTRAVFIGGPKGVAIPWHAASEILRRERDVVVVRADQQALLRFRCNSYADALVAEFIARRLASARRRPV
jgi:hypothetical protein